MIIDCHGDYTTAPKALQDYREAQIAALKEKKPAMPARLNVTDDRIRESVEGAQLKLSAMGEVIATCKKHKVAVGHPHVDAGNVERVLKEGYTFLMPAPTRGYAGLEKGLQLAGRAK